MSIFINEASIVLASTAVFTYNSTLFYMQAPKVGIYIIEGELLSIILIHVFLS